MAKKVDYFQEKCSKIVLFTIKTTFNRGISITIFIAMGKDKFIMK